jgi:catechol 2,3-dioxygenase-like lactoylglutathione lyase family enzyme
MPTVTDLPLTVRAFSHVGISVTDLDRAVDFYTGVLGFRVLADARSLDMQRVILALDDLGLELLGERVGIECAVPEPTTFGKPKLAFTVHDLDAVRATAAEHGVPLVGDVIDTPASRVCWIRDPDGMGIQLHEFKEDYLRVTDLLT